LPQRVFSLFKRRGLISSYADIPAITINEITLDRSVPGNPAECAVFVLEAIFKVGEVIP
jgi:hypothetical protein